MRRGEWPFAPTGVPYKPGTRCMYQKKGFLASKFAFGNNVGLVSFSYGDIGE